MLSRRDLANAIRVLSIDSVEKANSGHPGAPMGMADIAEVLWRDFYRHNPNNPNWINRDRFVLSNGHSSILLYSILHLTGYDLSIKDLKQFRQLNSKTPGHPENICTNGVDTTTGPLGQGLGAAVGMAIAERTLGSIFNRLNYNIIDHYTWVFVGDGCLMEGISHEVCSLAGTLGLGKLIVFYDKNNISIDGNTKNWFTDNTEMRFQSYNWHVVNNVDGHNSESIIQAIEESKKISNKPSLIICHTIIGFGSPNKSGTCHVHGSPLGQSEVILTKKQLNCNSAPFQIDKKIYDQWDARKRGERIEFEWNKKFISYSKKYPKLALEYQRRIHKLLPENFSSEIDNFINSIINRPENIATRKSSQNTLERLGSLLPELMGGSADLTPSNLTNWSGSQSINKNFSGNYIHYGVREFGMTAIANGIANHGGFIPYTSTFLMFVEYAKNAVRMAALMKIRHIFIYTHDSIGLGEDGPTHQPIEQLASLRLTPNLSVWRPCDSVETVIAWKYALERENGPTALILSRQNLKQLNYSNINIKNIFRGGYIVKKSIDPINIILISTGSELELSLKVFDKLEILKYSVQLISMPSCDVFDKQDVYYKDLVLPKIIKKRVVIEAGVTNGWYKYIGLNGIAIGVNNFGESAPAEKLFLKFGFTVDSIVNKIQKLFFDKK
ncbi:Transketolase 2 [Buchnera aphidicola (Eriosoma grossulariae)]|uniref:transketolase n=1 Tax=Buchnera aphidicola TaxID=9 RepID=UPI0034638537